MLKPPSAAAYLAPLAFTSLHDPSHVYFITAAVMESKHLFVTDEYSLA